MVKKDQGKKVYTHFVDTECPICGKNFIPAPMHVYNDGNKAVCSYHCHLEAFRRREAAKVKKRSYKGKVIDPGRDDEIRRLASEGMSYKELSEKYHLGVHRIQQIISEGFCSK